MKLFFVFLLLVIATRSESQKLSLNDLINLKSMNLDDFDTYVLNKGYYFFKENTFEQGRSYSYSSREVNPEMAPYFISKYVYNDGKLSVSHQTSYKEDYLKFKTQLKTQGFTLTETSTFQGATRFVYNKGSINVVLYSTTDSNKVGDSVPLYEINVKQ